MFKISTNLLLAALYLLGTYAAAADNPRVELDTNYGNIVVELYPGKAPKTVDNFLQYVDSGFYDGTVFHRVIQKFMIQGGGFTADYQRKETRAPIKNEADNGLSNQRGTIAMARTADPDSATSQFFINTVDNPSLNFRLKNVRGWGYAVFGRVVDGMDVVDKIAAVPTTSVGPGMRDVPKTPVVIKKAARVKMKAKAPAPAKKHNTGTDKKAAGK